ncbi:MAG: hypothetical protein CSA76_03645 [Spirochaetales bacterium]|nr:MAG: hypothetical protein CSA76_03645 [Spirochaetales bacterium]
MKFWAAGCSFCKNSLNFGQRRQVPARPARGAFSGRIILNRGLSPPCPAPERLSEQRQAFLFAVRRRPSPQPPTRLCRTAAPRRHRPHFFTGPRPGI